MNIIYAIILVGILVFIHELGHFACAKFFGVRVLKVSLGFGPRILGIHLGGTEYVLSALPIGGYVKLLGDTPHDQISDDELEHSYHSQPVLRRISIALAGPVMNLILPLIIFFIISLYHQDQEPPVVGIVYPNEAADGILLPGDRVQAIQGQSIVTFSDITEAVHKSQGHPLRFEIERKGKLIERIIVPKRVRRVRELERVNYIYQIGVLPHRSIGMIAIQSQSSAAFAAGLRTFDQIIAARGQPIRYFEDLEQALHTRSLVPVTYLRPIQLDKPLGGLIEMDIYEPHIATIAPTAGRGSGMLRAGIESADLYVSHVRVASAEHRAGIMPGDRLISLNGAPIRLWFAFVEALRAEPNREHRLLYRRGNELHEARFRLDRVDRQSMESMLFDPLNIGVDHWVPLRVEQSIKTPNRVRYALLQSYRNTMEMISLTAYSFIRLIQGKLTVDTIGGPLSILEATSGAADEGALTYFTLLAFLSVNLGLMNLLPIPLLDGGHIVFMVIETFKRKPLSVRTREYASMVGLAILVLLLLVALVNDVERRWPEIEAAWRQIL